MTTVLKNQVASLLRLSMKKSVHLAYNGHTSVFDTRVLCAADIANHA